MRFGQATSALYTVITTVASCGAVTSAHDSLTGIGGLVPMFNMGTGEVIFGGVGSGLYGMLLFVLLAVFIAGLMVGRTPEYLGKKIGAREVKLVMLGTLAVPLMVLFATALAVATKYGAPSIYNPGPQGFSETLYAYVSQANNNGSAFAGFTGYVQPNSPGTSARSASPSPTSWAASPCCSAASCRSCSRSRWPARSSGKKVAPVSAGTFRTDSPTFVVLLIAVIVIVAALTLFPAFLLGPVVQGLTDHLF